MAETNINIYFYDQKSTGTPANPQDENKQQPDNPTEPKGNNTTKAVGAAVAKKVITTAIRQASARAGQLYGSNQLQEQINAIGSIVGYGTAIAINPVMGLSMMALDMGVQVFDYYTQRKDTKRTLAVLEERAGSSLNRSR